MSDEVKKDLCECDPETSPDHTPDAHDDEKNGPGATGWVNPMHNAPDSADYEDALGADKGPGVTPITPKPEVGPGV